MSRGERTYVSTAFVPFTRRRVDAVSDLLVDGLRANGFHAERLRLPVDVRSPQAAAAAAAAAALVDVTWAHRMIEIEFPCMQLLHGRAASWRVRGGLDCDLVPVADGGLGLRQADMTPRFDRDWAEPGARAGEASVLAPAPAGVLTDHLTRRGVLATDGTGTLIVSLDPSCDAHAQMLAAAKERSQMVTAPSGASGPVASTEARLWEAVAGVTEGTFGAIHVVLPVDADPVLVAALPAAAGALEVWTTVGTDAASATDVVRLGSGASAEAVIEAWAVFAGELVP